MAPPTIHPTATPAATAMIRSVVERRLAVFTCAGANDPRPQEGSGRKRCGGGKIGRRKLMAAGATVGRDVSGAGDTPVEEYHHGHPEHDSSHLSALRLSRKAQGRAKSAHPMSALPRFGRGFQRSSPPGSRGSLARHAIEQRNGVSGGGRPSAKPMTEDQTRRDRWSRRSDRRRRPVARSTSS